MSTCFNPIKFLNLAQGRVHGRGEQAKRAHRRLQSQEGRVQDCLRGCHPLLFFLIVKTPPSPSCKWCTRVRKHPNNLWYARWEQKSWESYPWWISTRSTTDNNNKPLDLRSAKFLGVVLMLLLLLLLTFDQCNVRWSFSLFIRWGRCASSNPDKPHL